MNGCCARLVLLIDHNELEATGGGATITHALVYWSNGHPRLPLLVGVLCNALWVFGRAFDNKAGGFDSRTQ